MVFLGHPHGYLNELGLYHIRPDGTGLAQIALQRGESLPGVETQISFQDMTFSDDGMTAAYWNWEPRDLTRQGLSCPSPRSGNRRGPHYISSIRRRVASCCPACSAMVAILLERQDDPTERSQLLVAPKDGPEPGLKLGEAYSTTYGWELSPDRAMVIFAAEQGPGLLISTKTGAVPEAASDFRMRLAGSGSRPERMPLHAGGPAKRPPRAFCTFRRQFADECPVSRVERRASPQ